MHHGRKIIWVWWWAKRCTHAIFTPHTFLHWAPAQLLIHSAAALNKTWRTCKTATSKHSWGQVFLMSNWTFPTETKLKCYMFVGFAEQWRKNELLCYYNHVSRVWADPTAKWERSVQSHQLENIDQSVLPHFKKFGAPVLRVPHWHQQLSQALFLNAYFTETNSNGTPGPKSLPRNHEQGLGSINQNAARRTCRQML